MKYVYNHRYKEKSVEETLICSTIFLDVSQAFDKDWIRTYSTFEDNPEADVDLLECYLFDRLSELTQN